MRNTIIFLTALILGMSPGYSQKAPKGAETIICETEMTFKDLARNLVRSGVPVSDANFDLGMITTDWFDVGAFADIWLQVNIIDQENGVFEFTGIANLEMSLQDGLQTIDVQSKNFKVANVMHNTKKRGWKGMIKLAEDLGCEMSFQ